MNPGRLKILFIIIVVIEILVFSDYLLPIRFGNVKVSGLACTCPDESVLTGRLYLRLITPDSLKQFDLDYSEIWVTARPFTNFDPMGVDLYLIEGEIIGKQRVSEMDPWNPVFKVTNWREVDILLDWIVKAVFVIQLLLMFFIHRYYKKSPPKTA